MKKNLLATLIFSLVLSSFAVADGFTLESPDVQGQLTTDHIFNAFGCTGKNISPRLTWKNAPKGKIRKIDVSIAKNYLEFEELDLYDRIVSMYLDFAEFQTKSKKIMYQKDWIEKLHKFLMLNDREILQDNGKITAKLAKELAENEFDKFNTIQDKLYTSDFDNLILELDKSKT